MAAASFTLALTPLAITAPAMIAGAFINASLVLANASFALAAIAFVLATATAVLATAFALRRPSFGAASDSWR